MDRGKDLPASCRSERKVPKVPSITESLLQCARDNSFYLNKHDRSFRDEPSHSSQWSFLSPVPIPMPFLKGKVLITLISRPRHSLHLCPPSPEL
jgi:hypothetical protein